MSFINYSSREVNCKIVYCGPGLSGKTTNVIQIFKSVRPDLRGRLVSLYTEAERTLYFDFLPIEIGRVGGFRIRFHLYTVPGQVCYGASRRLVFRGVDGIVFVADSQETRMDANYEAVRDLKENLDFYNHDLQELPYVLQINKRDLPEIMPATLLRQELQLRNGSCFEAVALRNEGVQETLKELIRQLMGEIRDELHPQAVG